MLDTGGNEVRLPCWGTKVEVDAKTTSVDREFRLLLGSLNDRDIVSDSPRVVLPMVLLEFIRWPK